MRRVIIALLVVLVSMGASANQPVSAASSQATIKKLRKQVEALKNSRELWHRRYDIAQEALDKTTTDLDTLRLVHGKTVTDFASAQASVTGQLTAANTAVAGLQGQLAQAQTGVSGLIGTISATDFVTKVLNPAASRWKEIGGCTSTYTSGNYWSVDFTPGPYC